MRKTKILLILGIICVVLFGVLFWTMTATENNQEIIQEEIIPTTQEIAQEITITDTGTTITGNTELTILMPGWFYNDGFAELAKNIQATHNITIKYKAVNHIKYYRDIIAGTEEMDDIDLYLLPSDRLGEYQSKKIVPTEDISPYMHSMFKNYDTFIPYAIDPIIVLAPDTTKIDDDSELTRKDIASYIINDGQKNKIRMPILRGLDKNDERLLETSGESFPNYFLITYHIIKQIFQGEDTNGYQIITDTINNINLSKRSYANFKITYNQLKERNKYCSTFPAICIISYNYGDMKFGFLSDITIQQKYFAGGSGNTTTLDIYNFPSTGDYPIRGRGFVANKDTTKDQTIQIFIDEYLKAGAQNTLPLRDDVLSVFTNVFNIQKIQKKYSPILKFENNFSLIEYSTDLQENFLSGTNFVSTIKEKNSQEEFFQVTEWQR